MTLPKAELHLHIEGTLEPELVFELAARNGIALPFADIEDLRSRYSFSDLQSFLDLYYAATIVLQTEADFRALAEAYLDRAAAQGLRHVELFFDPQAHTERGVPIEAVIDGLASALEDAEERLGITGGLILCFLRNLPVESAMATLDSLGDRTSRILGIGLDSTEVGYPPELFTAVYARARDLGLHVVAHAGEEGPPAFVTDTLDLLRAERIDHGIRSLEDPELVARLVAERIPLTVCPLSNVRLKVVDEIADHPLPAMIEAGILVTVNSDDPAYFGGYVGDNYVAIARAFGFDDPALAALARNSVIASFASDSRKAELAASIDDWLTDPSFVGRSAGGRPEERA
ncbi:adenosine deaminase [Naasia lichenicola]|uniref:Adenine deaminase n=1 Tax=Naasia lichenicola TaxID=2565933 RepID=A0A4S4FLQ9_9MICO|nr:adenosine deaminase [Naasia lichenicola]THG31118.1 adenosine deaminase [Naasia lichenicola]